MSSSRSAADPVAETSSILADIKDLKEEKAGLKVEKEKLKTQLQTLEAQLKELEDGASQSAARDNSAAIKEKKAEIKEKEAAITAKDNAITAKDNAIAQEKALLLQREQQTPQQQQQQPPSTPQAADLQALIDASVLRAMQSLSEVISPVETKTQESDEESLQSESVPILPEEDVLHYAEKMKAALRTKLLGGKKHKLLLVHRNNGSWAVQIFAPAPNNSGEEEGKLLCSFEVVSIKYLKNVYINWSWECLYDLTLLQNKINDNDIVDHSDVTTP